MKIIKTRLTADEIVYKLQRDLKEIFNSMADLNFECTQREKQSKKFKETYLKLQAKYEYIEVLLNFLKKF